MMLAIAASVIAFYVFARYRLPIVPLLILFAAAGIVAAAKAGADRRWRSLAAAGVVLLATALLARAPVFDRQERLAVSFFNWANVEAHEGRTDAAIGVYRETLRLEPRMAEAHYNLGTLLANREQLPAAIAEYRAAVGQRSDYPQAWNNLGVALALTGDRRGAAEALIRALEQDPRHPSARANLQQTLQQAVQADERDVQARIEGFLRGPHPGN
jgi:tetratricopeptide (TPR) repeat protein